MGKIVLVTGGVRSGKSSWALEQANSNLLANKVFIATAEPFDDEMQLRITNHRNERGAGWSTLEEPENLAAAVNSLKDNSVAVIDCCTVWLGNIWHSSDSDPDTLTSKVDSFLDSLCSWKSRAEGVLYIVSNEVGWGIVPLDESVRRYRDTIGKLNQNIARIADNVYLCVAGIAVSIKS